MFDTGFGTILYSLLVNIVVPIIPGILFLWLFLGLKRKGMIFLIFSWFVGVGVVAHWLFDIQFVRFGIGVMEYIVLIILLLLALGRKIRTKKQLLSDYSHSFSLYYDFTDGIKQRNHYGRGMKFLTGGMLLSILGFLINSFVFTIHFPTYGDDSFGNRNKPLVNILHDGGVKLFGERDEILGRGKLGYPIQIPLYKALISEIQGGYNDITTDMLQRLSMFFVLLFLTIVTRQKTKNIFYTLLPGTLIVSLPLIFIHTVESYHDLLVALYAILTSYTLYEFLENKENHYLVLGVILGSIMAYIKIEGLIIYTSAIVFSFFVVLLFQKKGLQIFKKIQKNERFVISMSVLLFLLPFQGVRIFHGLGFNPSSIEGGELVNTQIHWEIFNYFKPIFLGADNYGIVLIGVFLAIIMFYKIRKNKQYTLLYLFIVPLTVFILFTLVFLVTNNYKWVLDQTTVNRVFTMSFVLLFSFIGIIAYEYEKK